MLVELMKPDFEFDDSRGNLRQLVHEGWNQVNVITSYAQSERGGHFHKINREAFYIVSGKLKLRLSSGSVNEEYEFKAGDMFLINKQIMHSFEFREETVLVSMYDKGVEQEDGNKDIYSEW